MADPQSSWSDLALPFIAGLGSLGAGFAAGRNPGAENPSAAFLQAIQIPQIMEQREANIAQKQALQGYYANLAEHQKRQDAVAQAQAARQQEELRLRQAENERQAQERREKAYWFNYMQGRLPNMGGQPQGVAPPPVAGSPPPMEAQGAVAAPPQEGSQAPTAGLPTPPTAGMPTTQGDYEESFSVSPEGPRVTYALSERAKNRRAAAELFPNDPQGQREALMVMSGVASKAPSMAFDPSNITNLHSQFRQDSGEYVLARDGWRTMEATLRHPSPAGDVALIFNFMKIVEPGSVVRESEQAVVQRARPYLDSIGISLEKVVSGQGMNDKQRADLAAKAQSMYGARLMSQKQLEDHYAGIATRHKINPGDIVIPYAQQDYRAFFGKDGHFAGRAPMSYEQNEAWTQAYVAAKGNQQKAAVLYERILKAKGVNLDAPAIDTVYSKARQELQPEGVLLP